MHALFPRNSLQKSKRAFKSVACLVLKSEKGLLMARKTSQSPRTTQPCTLPAGQLAAGHTRTSTPSTTRHPWVRDVRVNPLGY